jgi:DNA-binding beta-propeller fold protein YncE
MVAYLRKDLTAQVWNYGAEASVSVAELVDPYLAISLPFAPEIEMGAAGTAGGQFNGPRSIAVAPDGSLYIADSRNHRIQHLGASGDILGIWGGYGAEAGQFNEPWGVAVGPDGSVYVADTWNNRIQQFTAGGEFVWAWGYAGQGDAPNAFYGPRGIAVDGQGHVYVADTGNKRVVVFDGRGNYIAQIGSGGFSLGQFDEPVGVAVDPQGKVYVTDTWNQRIQVFTADPGGLYFAPVAEWPLEGWYGQSLENKPFVAVSARGIVYVSDPEACRVIEFSAVGVPMRAWGDCSSSSWVLPAGLALDGQGGLWVSDAGAGRLIYFEVGNP